MREGWIPMADGIEEFKEQYPSLESYWDRKREADYAHAIRKRRKLVRAKLCLKEGVTLNNETVIRFL